jgi:predicted regulator of amino acid metabolism with ACT domain
MVDIWKEILKEFSREQGKLRIVRLMLDLGVKIDSKGRLAVGNIAVTDLAMARAANTDRRVVRRTANKIMSDPVLKRFFSALRPGAVSIRDAAKQLGHSVIEITADAHRPGVISKVTSILAEDGAVILQADAQDPEIFPEPKLTLVVKGKVPIRVLERIRSLRLVKTITLV